MRLIKLPEPWASMTEEDAKAMTPENSRAMLASVRTPALDTFRAYVQKAQPSELATLIAHVEMIEKHVIPDALGGCGYDGDDAYLVLAAGILAVGDAFDAWFTTRSPLASGDATLAWGLK